MSPLRHRLNIEETETLSLLLPLPRSISSDTTMEFYEQPVCPAFIPVHSSVRRMRKRLFETSFLGRFNLPLDLPLCLPPLRSPGPIPPSTSATSPLASPPSISSPPISSRTDISTPSTVRSTSKSSPRRSRSLPRVSILLAIESLISVSLVGSEPRLPFRRTRQANLSTQPSLQCITITETLSVSPL
jgi:hypothetical protein